VKVKNRAWKPSIAGGCRKKEKKRFNFFDGPDIVIQAPSDEEIQKLLEEKTKSTDN
jgi:hypothetical protein